MDRNKISQQIKLNREFRRMIENKTGFGEDDIFNHKIDSKKKTFNIQRDSLKEIRVAAIMDGFTLECFKYECVLTELTPSGWKEEMVKFGPDLLFIESAWLGKNGLWHRKVDRYSIEIDELTEYCHTHSIPVVFWNKEDPMYTDAFMSTAMKSDFIFTTDIDCIQQYKMKCMNGNVFHLHFGAQPVLHNPIEKHERKDRFCFAGAYYRRYTKRCETFDDYSDYFIKTKGFDIFDRNYDNPESPHKFPELYDPYIIGGLEPKNIDVAYKGYFYGINMNSVNQSQTMFARRVFELLASNTISVGNYSRGVKNYFGDLTICTDDLSTLEKNFERFCSDEQVRDKYRLLGLRKVLSEHLMEDRFRYIINKVTGNTFAEKNKEVAVVGKAYNKEDADLILKNYSRQKYANKRLYIVTGEEKSAEWYQADDITVIKDADELASLSNIDYVALFSPNDWYGENYITDFVLSTRYTEEDVYCKGAHFIKEVGCKRSEGKEYISVESALMRMSFVKYSLFITIDQNNIDGDYDLGKLTRSIFSIDRFNYCKNLRGANTCPDAEDMHITDDGISLADIYASADNIKVFASKENMKRFNRSEILSLDLRGDSRVIIHVVDDMVRIDSDLPEDIHDYYYIPNDVIVSDYEKDGRLTVKIQGESTMNIMGCVLLLDEKKKKIEAKTGGLNRTITFEEIPEGTVYARVGIRLRGKGGANVSDISIGEAANNKVIRGFFLTRSNVLVLTNNYPSANDLYRNGFVQTRVQNYLKSGKKADVMRMNPWCNLGYREYRDVNVFEGGASELGDILDDSRINTVCVHFLEPDMWEVLKTRLDRIRLLIWCHGAEIQPWWRRKFNYSESSSLDKGKELSEIRMTLFNEVFSYAQNTNIEFVFVSKYFSDEVFEDYKVDGNDIKFHIIHNHIDTDVFCYEEKQPDSRLQILTIKSFSSSKYANDLTAKAIVELSKKEYFDELHFDIYGMGEEFEEANKMIRDYDNVSLHNSFLTPDEMKSIHKRHGVYIATTRWDSQGVSRDEAASSGLVPIANAVAAIPEFVDNESGYLVPEEDYMGVVDAIEEMYYNPDIFLRKSKAAAEKVRNLSDYDKTIRKEIELIYNGMC